MRECWINVYEHKGNRWIGDLFPHRIYALQASTKYLIYRIHVRMKYYPDERMIAY